jgi:uncharacterized protein YecE (DUF72 family)
VEVRHESFLAADFIALARKFQVAVVIADSAKYPMIADITADFVYVRLQQANAKVTTGYKSDAIKLWAARTKAWEKGAAPKDLPYLGPAAPLKKRDVFAYMINGAKERAPAAAIALAEALD